MPRGLTLPFYDFTQAVDWLDGWTPVEIIEDERKAMLPGICFVPYAVWELACEDAEAVGILNVRPVKYNESIMLTDWLALEGLRQSEEERKKVGIQAMIQRWKPRIGETARVTGHWFDGIVGVIRRLERDYVHLEVPGMASRLTVSRHLLEPI